MNDKQVVSSGGQKTALYESTLESSQQLADTLIEMVKSMKDISKELANHVATYYIAKNVYTGQFLEPYLDLNKKKKFKYVDYFVFLTAEEVELVQNTVLSNQVDIFPESSFYCKSLQDEWNDFCEE